MPMRARTPVPSLLRAMVLLALPGALAAETGTPVPADAPPATHETDAVGEEIGTGVTLLMVEQAGCIYCARWDAEVAPEYPLTAEGEAAPLARADIRSDLLDTLEITSRPVLTPTFILLRDGVEVSRLEGYPGEDFFWGLLQRMLTEADIPLEDGP